MELVASTAPTYRTVREPTDLTDLSDYLTSALRYRPVLIITGTNKSGRKNYPAGIAADDLPEADVYWVPDAGMQWKMGDILGTEMNVYQGAARMIWPRSEGLRYRFFDPPRDDAEVATGLRLMAAALGSQPAPPPRSTAPAPEGLAPEVAALKAKVADLRTELGKALAAGEDARSKLQQAQGTIRDLRRAQRDAPAAEQGIPVVFADPAEQFQHEVWLTYLDTVSEPERDTWELRDYRFGPDWFASIDVADRRKVVTVVVEILTRRAIESDGRKTRQLHDGKGTKGALIVRPDGSTAWRANLQTGTPSARRIMWWELPDGTVELGKVALHDDCKLR